MVERNESEESREDEQARIFVSYVMSMSLLSSWTSGVSHQCLLWHGIREVPSNTQDDLFV